MKFISFHSKKRETGAVLVVSLLILLVMTIIGVTSMQTASLEEKMAGNLRDNDLAFQAAEAALRGGEEWIETIVTVGNFNGSNGLYGQYDDTSTVTWESGDSIGYSGVDGVAEDPRYIIQIAGKIKGARGGTQITGYKGGFSAGKDVTAFEVTARGTGASADTTATVRSLYGRRL